MTRQWIAMALLVLLCATAQTEEVEGVHRVSAERSPQGTFDLMTYTIPGVRSTETEIHVQFRTSGGGKQVLFKGGEATRALIAPDEAWIVVNAPESGVAGLMHLFRRNDEGQYEHYGAKVERRALAAMMKSRGLSEAPHFDVFFCYADFWARDSGCLLGHIEGRVRGSRKTSRFYFVYDPTADRVSLDLGTLNRGAFEAGIQP